MNGLTHVLKTIDPKKPLDDLEPLRDIIGDARIVGIGESVHFTREFWQLRQRLLRFLHERCGFNIFAIEYSFVEGIRLDPWFRGTGALNHLPAYGPSTVYWGNEERARWLRKYNKSRNYVLHYAGIDIAEGGGTMLPALILISDYLKGVDVNLIPELREIFRIALRISSPSPLPAMVNWGKLATVEQEKLTSFLSRLYYRFFMLRSEFVRETGEREYNITLQTIKSLICTDYMHRALYRINTGEAFGLDLTARTKFMADATLWHLKNSDPGSKIMLNVHNSHVQKFPVGYGPHVAMNSMGSFIEEAIGDDYCGIALTHTDDHALEMEIDQDLPVGFSVEDVCIGEPIPESVEGVLWEQGYGNKITLTDLRNNKAFEKAENIRCQSNYINTQLPGAFDALISVPKISYDHTLDNNPLGRSYIDRRDAL